MFSFIKINHLCLSFIIIDLLLSGCKSGPSVSSTDIATSSIYPTIKIESLGDVSTVTVDLDVGKQNGTNIYLSEGEILNATANGQSLTLKEHQNLLGHKEYSETFNLNDPGTLFAVLFNRPADKMSALDTVVSLPEDIEILEPQSGANFTHQDDITVSWEPSGEVTIIFDGTCQDGTSTRFYSSNVKISGSETFSMSSLLGNIAPGDICTAIITLERYSTGTVSPEYKGGVITAKRSAIVSVNITP